ncbi:MAG TPA: DEAD/DEAH box helicase, partial [Tepidisphaeraceae bacterium]|nr:DEAD/DEAH box helicase [Tepidisphaeraceae bacterium]
MTADAPAVHVLSLAISPQGKLHLDESGEPGEFALAPATSDRIRSAFNSSAAAGLFHLGTAELQTPLPPQFAFARELARQYLTRLCHTPGLEQADKPAPALAPDSSQLETLVQQAPPMKGLEYLTLDALAGWWADLDTYVRGQIEASGKSAPEYLREKNPLWRSVGRVTFHLAENKRDESYPFAFLATYASRLSAQGRVQHLPLANALQEYAGAKNRDALISLLLPIQRASEKSELVKNLVDAGDVYHPLAWSPRDAYRFLKDIPAMEESGILVRVPDWWKAQHPPRPRVSVKIGDAAKTKVGADAILDFSVGVTLDDAALTPEELEALLTGSGGLVALRGKWVEVDKEKLGQVLDHWKKVERDARGGGISFFEGMRLLAGANLAGEAAKEPPPESKEWAGVTPGEWLSATLAELRDPSALGPAAPPDLHAELRPYQEIGVNWLRFMTRLGLGACLADDMGLGKTIQVIALLLHLRREREANTKAPSKNLLIAPASLLANWKAELERFAPSLHVLLAHPSETDLKTLETEAAGKLDGLDLVMTTYGMLSRLAWLRETKWNLVILDEAQAIKNAGTRQTRAVKELKSAGRITLTGTPIENRLSDLWSLFDFLNPGLLGGAKAFAGFAKQLAKREQNPYGPLRTLVRPYILRRLKTDRKVIADLPDKTEVNAFCTLSKRQAMLYQQSVQELAEHLTSADGIKRKGIVLAYLMRLKQICNHPSQWLADGGYDPADSGKLQRLGEICEELAERQERPLIFTQFKEITAPLAEYLSGIFGRPGLVLHGQTPVKQRRELVNAFQKEDGPPFFVLS